MALIAKTEIKEIEGKEVPAFIAEFTNGNIEQLDELAEFLQGKSFDIPTTLDERRLAVLKVGIAWLERLKEQDKESEK